MNDVLLDVRDLSVHFPVRTGGLLRGRTLPLKAVDGVSFAVKRGETLGIVGESGCGKSTLGRAILRLIEPTRGQVLWLGQDLADLDEEALRRQRKDMQIIFQDPLASLDPRMTVGDIIAEPLEALEPDMSKAERRTRVEDMMDRVGLSPDMINRYPHEFSGGQCQRIGIARAMVVRPDLIVCDEAVSALDVSIQAQIVNLLMDLQAEFGLTLLFISHDLSVVRQISHRILVLYLGRVMELADRDALYDHPAHPYTKALISAVPVPDPAVERAKDLPKLSDDLLSPLDLPSGCVFRTRCPHARDKCVAEIPVLDNASPGHAVACHFWREIG